MPLLLILFAMILVGWGTGRITAGWVRQFAFTFVGVIALVYLLAQAYR